MWRASIPACSGDREFFRDPYLAGCGVSTDRVPRETGLRVADHDSFTRKTRGLEEI
jgi:hypothetical protein